MTVSTEISSNEYLGNGVTTSFPYTFKIFKDINLSVSTINADGVGTPMNLGTDYIVTGAGSYSGGYVVTSVPVPSGITISITRDLPAVQETDLRNQGKFFAEVHEDAFDYLTMLIQQAIHTTNVIDSKSIKVPEYGPWIAPNIAGRRNKLFAWNDSGKPIAVLPESGSAADVMIEFAKPTGANLSGFRQTTVGGRLSTEVYITDFGGGEAVTDNLAAFNLAKAAAGNGGTVTLPKNSTGIYNFSAFPDMTGVVINPDVGVVLRGPASNNAVNPGIITTRDYRVYFNAGDPKNYYIDMRANVHAGSKGANKSLWLTEGDIDNYVPLAVNANNILVKQIALGVGDTFANVTPAGRSASSLFLQPPTGGTTQLGVIPAVPGTELKVGVNNIPNNAGEIAVGIIYSTGYAALRGYPASGTWSLTTKNAGQASTDIVVAPDGGGTATYSSSNNIITVRSISPVRAQILINGVTAVDFQPASGVIQWVGVGATSISTVSSSNFTGWYTRQFKVASSPRSQVLGIIGDSISDAAVDGSWPVWAAEALDSSFGIRINSIENRAVSGQTIDQQIANLAANPFVNASIVAVFIGTNDIQGGNTLSAFQSSMTTLLNTLQSQGRQTVLVIPPQWILKTDGTGLPDNGTVNSNRGGDIRAAIGRIAADRGIQVVDMTTLTGPINPGYYSSTFADPMLRDLIHPTAYGYRLFGFEIAKAIAAQICPVVKNPSDWSALPGQAAGLTNGVQYRFSSVGIELKGRLDGSTALNGLVLTLPEFLRQSSTRYFIAWGNTGPVPVYFNTDGTVLVHNNASSTQMSFDGIVLSN